MPTKSDGPPEAWFYHLERQAVSEALPELLEKTLSRGWRALVRCVDAELLDSLDERLWTDRPEVFLAHGRAGEAHADRQPILLTREDQNENGAEVLFILDEPPSAVAGFKRVVVVIDGKDEPAIARARRLWANYKAAGMTLAYWRQQETGGWSKTA